MAHTQSTSRSPEFEAFLYACVDEDNAEIPLSVLSALSRLDLDPWAEAERLAALSKDHAAHRLAGLIAKLPDASSARRNPRVLAARLVRLLPKPPRGARRLDAALRFLFFKWNGVRMSFLFIVGLVIGWVWIFPVSCQPQPGVIQAPRATSPPAGPSDGQHR
jgi:hypothetical protein